MKLIVSKAPIRTMIWWAQGALMAAAFLLLGYCSFAIVDSWIVQRTESNEFDRLLSGRGQRAASRRIPQSGSIVAADAPAAMAASAPEGLVGRIEIPRLHISAIVLEGDDGKTLRRAVGHIPGTPLPGQPGNVGLAGHRDTFLRPLKDLQLKDEIQVSTVEGNFKYQVESLRVVEPDNVGVLGQSREHVLTIVTCYPFSYIGAAPKRFVARARQVSPQSGPQSGVE